MYLYIAFLGKVLWNLPLHKEHEFLITCVLEDKYKKLKSLGSFLKNHFLLSVISAAYLIKPFSGIVHKTFNSSVVF